MVRKNKRGWIEIVEAFVAVLLVAGVLLVLVNKGYIGKSDISEQVYTAQISILREIETNDNFREELFNLPLPTEFPQTSGQGADVQQLINSRAPSYLTCQGKICAQDDICDYSLSNTLKKDIYSQDVTITSPFTSSKLEYRKLKIFCWTK